MTGDQPLTDFVAVDPVSSSGSGRGPPDLDSSTTPEILVTPTPPVPPRQEVAQDQGASSKVLKSTETQTISFCVDSFSSKTCFELLKSSKLTPDQVQHEANYFRTLNHERELRHKPNLSEQTINNIINNLKSEMSESMYTELDSIILNTKYDLTLNNF